MLAVLLALGSAVGWGTSDFLGGLKSRSMPMLTVLLVSQLASLALLAGIVVVSGAPVPDTSLLLVAAAAGLGEVVGVSALYRGLAVGTMSLVAPVASVAPAVPLLAGLALGEVPTAVQAGGLFLALAGIVLTSLRRGSAGGSALPSVGYGLISALGFGVFFVALDAASEGAIPWALLVARLTAVSAIVVAVLLRRPRLAVRPAELPVLAGIGALLVAADSLYALASTRGLLGVVAVLAALHTVVTMGLARVHLHERVERLQRVGVAVCLCGVLAIAVG